MNENPLLEFFGQLAIQNSYRGAKVGNGSGTVDVPGRPHAIYARLGGADGPVAEVHTTVVHPNNDDDILIVRESALDPAGWRMVFWLRDGSDPSAPAPAAV